MRKRSSQTLLACPRISPEWELSTLDALMRPKPATRGKVEHRQGEQPWSRAAESTLTNVIHETVRLLELQWEFTFPPAGEYFVITEVPAQLIEPAKAIAVAMSRALPEHWFVLGNLFVRGGQFFRRRRGYKLDLVVASNVHLTKALRAKLRKPTSGPLA